MKTLLFGKAGDIFLIDKFTNKKEKITTLKYYLDCPVIFEGGLLFGTFFEHIIKEKDFLNNIFKETMNKSIIDNFIDEWNIQSKSVNKNKGIQYIKAYKVFDYIELSENKIFIDVRIDLDGVGCHEELYNLEFIPLNELKKLPFILSDNISIYKTVSNLKGKELFFDGVSFTSLFNLIGSVLYMITTHNNPKSRESAKNKFISVINDTNLIEILEKQKENSIKNDNYEEASYFNKILDKLKNGFINK